jgi:hypothetical protein
MAAPTRTQVLNDPVVTATDTYLATKYQDVVFEPSPLLGGAFRLARMPGTPKGDSKYPEWTNKGELIKRDGREAWYPLATGSDSNATEFGRADTLSLNVDDVGTVMRCEYANYTAAASILWVESRENTGEQKVIDLYKSRWDQSMRTLSSLLEGHLWNSQADTAEGTQKKVVGLQTLISTGTTNTVWKLSRTTYSYMRNYTDTTSASFATSGLARMRTAYTNVSGNGGFDRPTCIGTTQVLFNAYQAEAEDIHRITTNGTADMGMETILYKGIPMFWSDNCLTGAMYFFNLNYRIAVQPMGAELETIHYPASSFPNEPVSEGMRAFIRFNWGFSRYDRQGVLSGFTDT